MKSIQLHFHITSFIPNPLDLFLTTNYKKKTILFYAEMKIYRDNQTTFNRDREIGLDIKHRICVIFTLTLDGYAVLEYAMLDEL